MNFIVLIGRLTKDPELKYTPNGVAVTNFNLAVDRSFTNQAGERETDFIPIVVWQKLAETCANHLAKGRMVAVTGRLQVRSYDTEDGQRRWVTEVVGSNVKFLDWGKDNKGKVKSETQNNFSDVNLEDLPFSIKNPPSSN